jgi:hypothetical protein
LLAAEIFLPVKLLRSIASDRMVAVVGYRPRTTARSIRRVRPERTLDGELLQPRYAELLAVAQDVIKALAIRVRVVDILTGLRGSCASPPTAAFLLVLCLAAGRKMAGPSAALKLVFELPEEIFRCWAFVTLGSWVNGQAKVRTSAKMWKNHLTNRATPVARDCIGFFSARSALVADFGLSSSVHGSSNLDGYEPI